MSEQIDLLTPDKPKRKYTRRAQPKTIEQTAVAVRQDQQQIAPVSEVAAIIGMIERAAKDDTVNVDKMKELLAMRRQVMAEAAEQAFNDAMTKVQKALGPIAPNADNPQTRSKYATFHALDKVIRPIYTQHGFALSYDTGEGAPELYVRVVCFVTGHGHTRKYHIDIAADGKGAKGNDVMTKTHAIGSAVMYGRRYLLNAIFNIAIGESDDDGNAANAGEKITENQAQELTDLAVDVNADRPKFYEYVGKAWHMKISSMADIPAARYADAKAKLEAKRGK